MYELQVMSRLFSLYEWSKTKWTYQSRLSEELSIKSLRCFLIQAKLADCVLLSRDTFRNLMLQNTKAFWNFSLNIKEILIYNLLWILFRGYVELFGYNFFE